MTTEMLWAMDALVVAMIRRVAHTMPTVPLPFVSHDLKSYEESAHEESENPVVIGYNRSLIETKCMHLSPEYDRNLDLGIIVRELFQPDE